MTETRRQVFKTSVVSIFGFASASALAGCTTAPTQGVGPENATSIIVGYSGTIWYVFKPDSGKYQVYKTPYGAIAPSTLAFDTQRFYDKAYADGALTQITQPFYIGATQFTFESNSPYLDATSQAYLTRGANNSAVTGRWNEIGRV